MSIEKKANHSKKNAIPPYHNAMRIAAKHHLPVSVPAFPESAPSMKKEHKFVLTIRYDFT